MLGFITRRLLAIVPVFLTVTLFVFSIIYLGPGDPALVIAGEHATPDQIASIRQALNLDQPLHVRYIEWLFRVMLGDLGNSIFTGMPVRTMILFGLGPTFALLVTTLIISILVAVPVGVLAAWRRDSLLDRAVTSFTVLAFSIPVFVVGYSLSYIFALKLQWLPVQGYSPMENGMWPFVRSLILPSITLSAAFIALLAKMTRTTMLDVLSQDYIRTARAKGLDNRSILYSHALKNASGPILTVIGIGFAMLLGGAVVTESIFAIPGLGRLTVEAILRRDLPVIQGIVLFLSISAVLINLCVDLSYRIADPRIRFNDR